MAFLFTACGSDTTTSETENATTEETPPPQPSEPVPGVAISPKPAAVDFPDATITSMSYQDGVFRFGVDGGESGYQLGVQTPDAETTMCANSAQGQHIHLIVDNAPYAAKYQGEFDYEIADGEHFLMAFLSRSYHESIKHDNAFKALKIQVSNNSIENMEAIVSPMLFYSRPKGAYTGKDTENIMLDFYPINTDLGNKHLIKVEVAGHTFTVDKWQPYYLTGLPMGENTVTLTLTDLNGNVLDTPYNPVSRTITLTPSPDQAQ
jgi:hypothetical protein